MAETTVEQVYQARIDDLQRLHKEALGFHDVRYQELEESAQEREAELKAQADGLLGALGRVNAENAELKTRLQDDREKCEHMRLAGMAEMQDLGRELERLRDEKKRLSDELSAVRGKK